MSNDFVNDIKNMHDRYGMTLAFAQLNREELRALAEFRLKFTREELDEGFVALEEGNWDDFVDATIDRIVVDIGTLLAFDVNIYEAWERVLKANLNKIPGVKPGRPNPFGLPDLMKPEGWTAPTHADNVGRLAKIS